MNSSVSSPLSSHSGCVAELGRRLREKASSSPRRVQAKQFLSVAQDAGIDLKDADALNTFVAGWNARSGIS